jgi:hypothetical protein
MYLQVPVHHELRLFVEKFFAAADGSVSGFAGNQELLTPGKKLTCVLGKCI